MIRTLVALLALTVPQDRPKIAPPPDELKLDPFYKKYLDADGIPVTSSDKVSDAALYEAKYLIDQMLINRPDVRKEMAKRKVRVMVMAPTEMTTDVPEQKHMDKEFWDARARGLGGQLTSCGEENLLNLPGDRYVGENILIHEFAHCIANFGLRRVDKEFQQRLDRAFANAKEKGLWEKTYALTDAGEYWAEAVQSYFDCNRSSDPPNGVHNTVSTREKLKDYDPEVFKLIEDSLGKTEWRYKRPADRVADGN
jgi:alpha-glucosidase